MAEEQNALKTHAHCQFCPGITFASPHLQPLGFPTSNNGFHAHPVPKIMLWVPFTSVDSESREIKQLVEA